MRLKQQQRTVELKMSWGNIQDALARHLYPLAKGKIDPDDEIVSIKLNYGGGLPSQEEIIPLEVITRKGVSKLNIGKEL